MPGKLGYLVQMGIRAAEHQPCVQQRAILFQLQLCSSASNAQCKERQPDVMPESSKAYLVILNWLFASELPFVRQKIIQSHQAVRFTLYQRVTAVMFKPYHV